jgi:hypothetical protein
MHIDLNEDPGTGNLNVRAYYASIVGPRRIAHGQRTVKRAPIGGATVQLLRNSGPNSSVLFFEVWLPQQSLLTLGGGGALLSFSGSDNSGENGYQLVLTTTQRYSGVLLPDDQLFVAALTDATGAPLAAPVSVVIASVGF